MILKGWKKMKKNKRIPLVVVILIIICIIFIICKLIGGKEDKSQKLAKIYEKLYNSQSYLFEMEQNSKANCNHKHDHHDS